jgi:uncharacterized protein YndB with AHSA1/START domain/DNA-binding transcriptional ArsR family regulator
VEDVFRALGDPSRRLLLDRLFERDGQTLSELCAHLPGMTRFGVMNHLSILETAGLVTTRKVGRQKLHYLNPVPIRLVHDRWIGKFAAPVVGAMAWIKTLEEQPMAEQPMEEQPMERPRHVYTVFVRSTPERVWRAITDGAETQRYYYGTRVSSSWEVGAPLSYANPDGTLAADGSVLEIEPGRRISMAFHPRWDPELEAAGPVRMVWEVSEGPAGTSQLTVTVHDLVPGSRTETDVAGGMPFILSGLKTLVETGEPLVAAQVAV